MSEWRGENTAHQLFHEFKLRLTLAKGALIDSKTPQDHPIESVFLFQGACLQVRLSIELLFLLCLQLESPPSEAILVAFGKANIILRKLQTA